MEKEKFVYITREHYQEFKTKKTDKEKLEFFDSLIERLFNEKYKINENKEN